ncbi:MAG TPA: ankyrin repeat domain-containing protein, partial [Candidatus Acidoferrales bacterium]|nr:ankyrin repeat domain-containing protein [Candidatus Acidoferrales bacterium]
AAGEEPRALALLERDASLAHAWSADGFTALHLAAFFDRPALAARLLALHADPRAEARNATRVAPLHSAAASRSLATVRALIAAGADVNARQSGGFTALMSAAQAGDAALAEALLAAGADPSLATDDGRTAASLARAAGHAGLAAKLEATGR